MNVYTRDRIGMFATNEQHQQLKADNSNLSPAHLADMCSEAVPVCVCAAGCGHYSALGGGGGGW